jgi:lysophospholipase L1-like esterase
MINRSVHCDLSGKPGTLVVGHSDFAYNGWPYEELYQKDLLHLNSKGSRILASKLRSGIHMLLGLQ